jgi:dephospho-CoA kinase
MPKTFIALVGLPGSGKSTIRRYIRDKYKARTIASGDIIREETRRRGLKKTPENDAKIALWFHSSGREKLLVKRLWKKVKNTNRKIIVIDGFRSTQQLNYFVKLSKLKPIIVYIRVPFKIRAQRLMKRRRWGAAESMRYIKGRETREKKQGVMKIIKKKNYTIDNSKTLKQAKKNTDMVMKKVLQKAA